MFLWIFGSGQWLRFTPDSSMETMESMANLVSADDAAMPVDAPYTPDGYTPQDVAVLVELVSLASGGELVPVSAVVDREEPVQREVISSEELATVDELMEAEPEPVPVEVPVPVDNDPTELISESSQQSMTFSAAQQD